MTQVRHAIETSVQYGQTERVIAYSVDEYETMLEELITRCGDYASSCGMTDAWDTAGTWRVRLELAETE